MHGRPPIVDRALRFSETREGAEHRFFSLCHVSQRTDKNEKLVRESRSLTDRANEADDAIEKAYRFERLEKILGIDEINRLLKERIPHKQEKHNMKEIIR